MISAACHGLRFVRKFPSPDVLQPLLSSFDTIEVLHNNRAERIRLHGIDCPEKGQANGQRAKHATAALS